MQTLSEKNPDQVLELLSERFTFERSTVELYDAVIEKLNASGSKDEKRMVSKMKEHRNEEEEHATWLEEQITVLGGNPSAKTERSKLVEKESAGIKRVILDGDPDVAHLFHALLNAELTDNAGWELLVQLAHDAGDQEATRELTRRLREEEDHLTFLREAVAQQTARDVLGERRAMPH